MNFERLFLLREKNNLGQKEIAKVICVSQQTYSTWEVGTKIIPLKHLNKICNYYHVSLDYVLGLSSRNNNYKNIENLNRVEIGKRIKIIRQDNKLTLRSLAKELNTTSSTISAYETGKTLILTAFAYQIAKKYKISLDWLVGRCEVKTLN